MQLAILQAKYLCIKCAGQADKVFQRDPTVDAIDRKGFHCLFGEDAFAQVKEGFQKMFMWQKLSCGVKSRAGSSWPHSSYISTIEGQKSDGYAFQMDGQSIQAMDAPEVVGSMPELKDSHSTKHLCGVR